MRSRTFIYFNICLTLVLMILSHARVVTLLQESDQFSKVSRFFLFGADLREEVASLQKHMSLLFKYLNLRSFGQLFIHDNPSGAMWLQLYNQEAHKIHQQLCDSEWSFRQNQSNLWGMV